MFLCQRMAPVRLDSRIAGRGEVFLFPEWVPFGSMAPGPPRPGPGLLFVRTKSNQYPSWALKHARREKPFRWGFSPVTPSSTTTQRGGRPPPFGIPRMISQCPARRWVLPLWAGVAPLARGRSPLEKPLWVGGFSRGEGESEHPPPLNVLLPTFLTREKQVGVRGRRPRKRSGYRGGAPKKAGFGAGSPAKKE